VVANAAIQRWKGLMDMDDADWRDVIDNNLNGTANTIRAFAPKMIPRKYGRIIVLSSIAAETGGVIDPHYAAG
jgi:NAD(P)-dependent dehydrogenase (short-subunit alcohol dehydrogenase family)